MKRDLHDRLARLEAYRQRRLKSQPKPTELYLEVAGAILGLAPEEVWPYAQEQATKEGTDEWLHRQLVAHFIGQKGADNDRD